MPEPAVSVVVPAHDEAAVIGRLLTGLGRWGEDDEVIVICDGCTDRTSSVAKAFPGVTVIEQPRSGKPEALNAGDRVASVFPRFYVDADIVVTMDTLREVARAMHGGVLAGAPRMVVDLTACSSAVRRFYDIWTRLPFATGSVLGSGVIGLTKLGRSRFGAFPDYVGDDEFVRRLFAATERVATTQGEFVVFAPRRIWPLIRIKTRGRLGILQLDAVQGPAHKAVGPKGASTLPSLLRRPRLWPSLAVFGVVRIVISANAHWKFRRRHFGEWARDDTTRVVASSS